MGKFAPFRVGGGLEIVGGWSVAKKDCPTQIVTNMSHQIYTITKFEIVAPYTLHLTFNDGVEKTIDLFPILRGELFSPLRDLSFFNQVRLDPETRTIVWPNEADFDPATLHDWDEVGPEMIEMASKWAVYPSS